MQPVLPGALILASLLMFSGLSTPSVMPMETTASGPVAFGGTIVADQSLGILPTNAVTTQDGVICITCASQAIDLESEQSHLYMSLDGSKICTQKIECLLSDGPRSECTGGLECAKLR